MKKKILLCASILIFLVTAKSSPLPHSGEYKKIFEQAETFFSNENYPSALPLYIQLDSMEPGSANMAFKIGFCYLNSPTYKTKSIPFFEKAVKDIASNYEMGKMSENKAPMSTYYYLAKAYHLNYEFDKAIAMYEKYKTELGTDP